MVNHSSRQQQYLFRLKRDRILICISRLLLLVFFLLLWEIASRKQWIDSFIFSSPSLILETFIKMLKEQSLTAHIQITLTETLVSFLLVMILGILSAVILWLFPKVSKVLEPYLVVLNSLPKSALAPLLIVWLGANQKTIIVSGISVAIFGCILNLYTGFTEISHEKLKLIRTLGGGRMDELFKIILPSSVPTILSNMKVNIGLCLVGVIIGEFIGARQGLGYLIIYGSQTFKLTWVLMSIVILMIIAMLLYGILNLFEKKVQKH
nr:ABC transporter permease [uncultured Blautia sp.]